MCTDPSSSAGVWVGGDQGVFKKTTSNQILMGKIGLSDSGQEWFPPSPQMQTFVLHTEWAKKYVYSNSYTICCIPTFGPPCIFKH